MTMAKIDCSVTVNFLKELVRMCDICPCKDCPINELVRKDNASCGYYLSKHPEYAVETVQKWSDEHPQKTRLEDLLEKYPNIETYSGSGPNFAPYRLGYCNNCIKCHLFGYDKVRDCWDEPVDGGATGKAVE